MVLQVRDLRLDNLISGDELVRNVSFALRRGRTLGVVGESGSGKTLTCDPILGILPKPIACASGAIEILGRTTAGSSKRDWLDIRGNVLAAVSKIPGHIRTPRTRALRRHVAASSDCDQGEVVESGRTPALATRPQHPYTRLLISSAPTLSGAALDRELRLELRAELEALRL